MACGVWRVGYVWGVDGGGTGERCQQLFDYLITIINYQNYHGRFFNEYNLQ